MFRPRKPTSNLRSCVCAEKGCHGTFLRISFLRFLPAPEVALFTNTAAFSYEGCSARLAGHARQCKANVITHLRRWLPWTRLPRPSPLGTAARTIDRLYDLVLRRDPDSLPERRIIAAAAGCQRDYRTLSSWVPPWWGIKVAELCSQSGAATSPWPIWLPTFLPWPPIRKFPR